MRQMMFGNQRQANDGRLGQLTTTGRKPAQARGQRVNQVEVRRALQRRRSPAYMQALAHMDQLGNVQDPRQLQQLQAAVQAEFGQDVLQVPGFPQLQGLVGPCYLGGTYDVHTLDLALNIVQHFHADEALPAPLQKARALAACRSYAFIEVYTDFCCCVDEGGTVTILED